MPSAEEGVAAAEAAGQWESVALLQRTCLDIPEQISTEMSNHVQGEVQALWKDRVKHFWPTLMFSYATG